MQRLRVPCAAVFMALFALSASTLLVAQQIQYKADIAVSERSGANAWAGFVMYGAIPAYQFWLEPQYDLHGLLAGWQMRLFRLNHPNENLLEPPGNWHGLQPFHLASADLARGPDESAFGRTRTIRVRGTQAVVRIRIVSVDLAGGSLALHVEFRDGPQ